MCRDNIPPKTQHNYKHFLKILFKNILSDVYVMIYMIDVKNMKTTQFHLMVDGKLEGVEEIMPVCQVEQMYL